MMTALWAKTGVLRFRARKVIDVTAAINFFILAQFLFYGVVI